MIKTKVKHCPTFITFYIKMRVSGSYSEPNITSKTKLFTKLVNVLKPYTNLTKRFNLDIWLGYEYASGIIKKVEFWHLSVRIHMNSKETLFKGGYKYFQKLELLREFNLIEFNNWTKNLLLQSYFFLDGIWTPWHMRIIRCSHPWTHKYLTAYCKHVEWNLI